MRNLAFKRSQADEVWCLMYAKAKYGPLSIKARLAMATHGHK